MGPQQCCFPLACGIFYSLTLWPLINSNIMQPSHEFQYYDTLSAKITFACTAGVKATYVPTGFDAAVLTAPGAVTTAAGCLGKDGYEACVQPRARYSF